MMGSATPTATCVNITATLAQGSTDATTGGQVKQLQQFLTQHLNLQDNIVTGFFGPKTAQHLKEFQAEQGLDRAGRVGGLTRAALARMCNGAGGANTTSTNTQ
jgi:peptidoglycan hydrolase-like protein with peptidoglycan-binding domain